MRSGKKPAHPPVSSRECHKPRGGEKSHKTKTMNPVEFPDEAIIHPVSECSNCQADLSQVEPERVIKHQVFYIELHRGITEHQVDVKTCSCGVRITRSFRKNIKNCCSNRRYGEGNRLVIIGAV